MKSYIGKTSNRGLSIWVELCDLGPQIPFDFRFDLRLGLKDTEAEQIALVILTDHLGNAKMAKGFQKEFKRIIVDNLTHHNGWRLTEDEVLEALKVLKRTLYSPLRAA